jgi:DNA polymerase III subunit delta
MDALAFLSKSAKSKRQPVTVLFGDEDFLKRQCRDAVIAAALGDADPSFAVSTYAGDKLDFGTVRNDLETLPFLAPVRVVVVEQADPFVTAHRDALERYAAAPSKVGVLVLDVKTFPETTKLAKALPDAAKVSCKAPMPARLAEWCREWGPARHGKKLSADAAELLLELVGPQMGLLDQEMAKLAVAVGAKPEVAAEDVDRLVARTRDTNVFRILDAVGEGKSAVALAVLADLLDDGEDVFMVLGALTSQLRRLAAVNRLIAQGQALGPAMDAAGVPRWPQARQGAERQLRHFGRRRLDQLTEWLTEVNMCLRGGSPLPPRLQLERLIVKLSRPRAG